MKILVSTDFFDKLTSQIEQFSFCFEIDLVMIVNQRDTGPSNIKSVKSVELQCFLLSNIFREDLKQCKVNV